MTNYFLSLFSSLISVLWWLMRVFLWSKIKNYLSISLPVDTIVLSTGTISTYGTKVFASRKWMIWRIWRTRPFVLSTWGSAENTAVTTNTEGSESTRFSQFFPTFYFISMLWGKWLISHPGLLGPEGLKFPGFIRLAVSGFMSSGLCGPIEDIDMLLLSRLSPVTQEKIKNYKL